MQSVIRYIFLNCMLTLLITSQKNWMIKPKMNYNFEIYLYKLLVVF